MWKKWHVNWNVSGGCNVNRRRFGERRPFQTEATVGKKDPRPERPSSEAEVWNIVKERHKK